MFLELVPFGMDFWPTEGTTVNYQFDGTLPGFEPTTIEDITS